MMRARLHDVLREGRRLIRPVPLAIAGLLASGSALADDCIASRPIAFDAFMPDRLPRPVALTLRVPGAYRHAAMGEDYEEYAHWMRPADARRARRSGDLPVANGFMYGKVSLDVGYDAERDVFIGAEDIETELRKAGYDGVRTEKIERNGHALLFVEAIERKENKPLYSLFVATGPGTTVVFIAWRPPDNDRRIGDCFWKAFRDTVSSSKSPR